MPAGKSLRAHAGDVTGVGSIPGAGYAARSWGAPWTEVGSSPQGCKESDRTEVAEHSGTEPTERIREGEIKNLFWTH